MEVGAASSSGKAERRSALGVADATSRNPTASQECGYAAQRDSAATTRLLDCRSYFLPRLRLA